MTSHLGRFLIAGFLVLVVNSAYLAAFADASVFYAANVLLHVLLGVLLALLAIPLARRLLGGELTPLLWWVVAAAMAATVVTGLALVVLGNLRPMRPLLVAHIAISVVAALLVVMVISRRLATAVVFGAIFFAGGAHYLATSETPSVNQDLPPATMAGESMGGENGPFFPSSARTEHGDLIPADFFMESATCGEAGCHPDIHDQWTSSAHRLASFNNQWYRKSVEYMQSVVGTEPSKWCGGCHDHAILFSGMMDTPIEEIIDRPEAHAGLGCVSCHSIVDVPSTMGNGGFVLEYPPIHDLATSENPWVRGLHDFVLRLDPEPHRRTFLKPHHQGDASTFCSSCHKVHLDAPVNHYRWLRGFNEYDNWQASGVSGEGARSFYYPAEPMSCNDCHMPLVASNDAGNRNGMVHSHRFAAANTALPVAYDDREQLEAVVDFLKAAQVTVDLFALVRGEEPVEDAGAGPAPVAERQIASTFAVGEEAEMLAPRQQAPRPPEQIFAPLDRVRPVLVRGESARIDAVVRTRNVGHFFPGGTVDAFEVWLELKAEDNEGRTLFWSGSVGDSGTGQVDPAAHFYRAFLLDGNGNPINKRNAWAARSVLYVRLIPPGAADTVRFRFHVPQYAGSEITLTAKLNYRKFSWWNTHWAYAGERDPEHKDFDLSPHADDGRWLFTRNTDDVSGVLKQVPQLPIVTMAQATVTLPVIEPGAPQKPSSILHPDDALRWNDYGIGLLLQGDLRGAEASFLRVTEARPDYADGWVNVARVRVQEGDPTGAQEALQPAMSLDPDLAKAHYFYGLTLKTEGRYDEALEHFRRAAAQYPRDRVVRNQIGRVLFLQREYTAAIEELEKTLRIDPEDLEAHYNLMLANQGLGQAEQAEQHQELYLRFKADEASQFLTGDYRRLHPADNNERQPIHEHRHDSTNRSARR